MKSYLTAIILLSQQAVVLAQPMVTLEKDMCAGSCSSTPIYITAANNNLFFSAADGATGIRFWRTDRDKGTFTIAQINAGGGGSHAFGFVACRNKTYFQANDNGTDTVLYVTDGTPVGTRNIHPILSIPDNIRSFACYNNQLYFTERYGLWKVDTLNGYVTGGITHSGLTRFRDLTVMNGKLYFSVDNFLNGRELWVTDGQYNGTNMVTDIYPGVQGSDPSGLAAVNNKLYFGATSPQGPGLFVSDGTAAGTQQLLVINGSTGTGAVTNIVAVGNKFYFSAAYNGSPELWLSNGTATGTVMLKDINPAATAPAIPKPVVCNGKVFFVQSDGTNGVNEFLWVTDGTAAGTHKMSSKFINPRSLTAFNNQLYFTATEINTGGYPRNQLWVTDGTPGNIKLVAPMPNPPHDAVPATELAVLGQSLYFAANYDNAGNELWKLTEFATGVEIESTNGYKIYPNPAANELHIDLQSGNEAMITVYSASGTVVVTERLNGKHNIIAIDQVPAGIYTIHMQQGEKLTAQKIAIMR